MTKALYRFLPPGIRGKGYGPRLKLWRDDLWDWRFRINTFGTRPGVGKENEDHFQGRYEAAYYSELFFMFTHIGLSKEDVFLDLGCGLARSMFVARKMGVKQAYGVEIDQALVDNANVNIARFRHADNRMKVVCAPAEEFINHDVNVIYLFNSFGRNTLRAVLAGLVDSLEKHPRKIKFVYYNPLQEHLLEECGAFTRVKHYPMGTSPCRFNLSFWESKVS